MNDMTDTLARVLGDAAGRSHNLSGQRLGRKGRDTRARILAAMHRLLARQADLRPISLSAVAAEALVGLTTLYLYFADMSELLLAALEPVAAESHALIGRFAERWNDPVLEQECLRFLQEHHAFWIRHSTILHLRNSCADGGDRRLLAARRVMSNPIIGLVARQMRSGADIPDRGGTACAVVLLTMIERIATIITDDNYQKIGDLADDLAPDRLVEDMIHGQARIMALCIRDQRSGAVTRAVAEQARTSPVQPG